MPPGTDLHPNKPVMVTLTCDDSQYKPVGLVHFDYRVKFIPSVNALHLDALADWCRSF